MLKRCFIAVNLPQEVRWELEALINDLEKINRESGIKFVATKQIHLTLHFLGNLTERQIDQVKNILSATVANFSATELITQGLNGFPDLKQPKVIYLETKEVGENQLAKLQKSLGAELKKIGLEIDSRPFTPHLTLARCQANCHFKTNGIELSELSIPVESIELMESQLNSEGSEYKIIESYEFNLTT